MEAKIKNEFKNRTIGNEKAFTIIKEHLKSSDQEEKQKFVYTILKECYFYLKSVSAELSSAQLDEISNIINECFNSNVESQYGTCQIEKILLFIMTELINNARTKECLKVARYAIDVLERRIGTDKSKIILDLDSVLKNCYLLLWNYGVKLLNSNDLEDSCLYFLYGLKCATFNSKPIFIIKRAVNVRSAFADSSQKLNWFKRFNKLVLSIFKIWSDIPENEIPELLHLLNKWNSTYAFALQKEENYPLSKEILLQSNLFLEKFVSTNTRSLKASPIVACSKCLELLKYGLDLFSSPINIKSSKIFTRTYLHLERIISKAFVLENNFVGQFALDVSRMLVDSTLKITTDVSKDMKEELLICIKSTWFFHLHLFSVTSDENKLLSNSSQSVKMLHTLFGLFVKFSKDDILISAVLTHSTSVIPKLSQCLPHVPLDEDVAELGLVLANLGVIAYRNGFFKEAIPFLSESCNILLKWCKQCEDTTQILERLNTVNLEHKYSMLIVCLRKNHSHSRCVKVLLEVIPVFSDYTSAFITYWVIVQNEIKNSTSTYVKKNIKQAFFDNNIIASDDELFRLLQLELQARMQQRLDTLEEKYDVVLAMKDLAKTTDNKDLNTSIALLEIAQLQWSKTLDNEETATRCCEKAIKLLSKAHEEASCSTSKADIKIQLARAFYWQYLAMLQANQEIARVEMSMNPVISLEQKLFGPKGDEEEDGSPIEDSIPHFINTSVNKELENFIPLDRAMKLWAEIIVDDVTAISTYEQMLVELQAAAEIYSLSRQESKERKAWILGRQLASRYNNNAAYIICTSRLVRVLCNAGDVKEVVQILQSCEKVLPKLNSEKTNEIYAFLRYQFALAEFSFYVKDVNGGLKILHEFWNHPFLEKKCRFSTLLCGELRMIAGQFVRVPAQLYDAQIDRINLPWGNANAIELVIQGMQYHLKLAMSSEGDDYFTAFSHYSVASLMNANLVIVQMFTEIGATRDARWYLKEQLKNSHRLALGIRMSEFMIGLGRLDILCDDNKECLSKLQTIQFLLDHETLDKAIQHDTDNKFAEADRLIFRKLQLRLPQYAGHSTDCNCNKCQTPILHLLVIQMMNLYLECLSFSGSVSDALQLSRLILKLSRNKVNKYLRVLAICEARLNVSSLLLIQNNYIEAISLVKECIKQLKALPYMCNKLAVLLPTSLYQKSICSLNAIAKRENVEFLNLVDSLWSINKNISKHDNTSDSKRTKKEVDGLQFSPVKLRSSNQENLCKAPEKKSRRFLDKWAKFEEPTLDNEDGNVPIRKAIIKEAFPVFDISSDENDSKEDFKTPAKSMPSLQSPLIDRANFENVRSVRSDSVTSNPRNRELRAKVVSLKYLKENTSKIGNMSNSQNRTERVTRSKSKAMTAAENSENLRGHHLDDTRNMSLNMDFDEFVEGAFEDESSELLAIECKVDPIEKLRSGRGKAHTVKSKAADKAEEVELPRNVDETLVYDQPNSKHLFEIYVESTERIELKFDEIIVWLEEAFSLISHHPIHPLYRNLCFLLALFKGPKDPLCGYYLSESAFVTLRHQCIINLGKKLKKLSSNENSVSLSNYYETLNFNFLPEEEKKANLEKHFNDLPKDWTVCQISFIPDTIQKLQKKVNQPLLLTRFQKGRKPIVARVPTATNKQNEVPFTLLEEFERINEENKNTMKSDNRLIWWESRRNLNERMKNFIADLEDVWISYWKGLFLGRPTSKDDQQRLSDATREILDLVGNKCNVDQECLEIFLDSFSWLTDNQRQFGISELFDITENSKEYFKLTKMIQSKIKFINSVGMTRQPVVLILGPEIESLPWESMPIIRNKSVSRMPSLGLLHGHLKWQMSQPESVFLEGVDSNKTYFVLNPSNDLPHTQTTFEEWFVKKQKWSGVIGRSPSESEFSNGLTSNDLFVYCGHGSGGKYLSGDLIQRLYCTAVTLLMGCSSGKLLSLGRVLEPSGTVLQYLLAGCPSIVANLWDVTDRDIDRFLESLLQLWLASKGEDLCNIIPKSRLVCRLPYLIGSAPVTYGLPVNIKSMKS